MVHDERYQRAMRRYRERHFDLHFGVRACARQNAACRTGRDVLVPFVKLKLKQSVSLKEIDEVVEGVYASTPVSQ